MAAADVLPDGFRIADYAAARRVFYDVIPDFWPDTDDHEYAVFSVRDISRQDAAEIRRAAEAASHIFERIAPLLRALPDDALLQMGYPENTLRLLRLSPPVGMRETVLGRFDFLKTPTGYKVLEFNADTPSFEKECFAVNGLVCDYWNKTDVNVNEESRLARALADACLAGLTHVDAVKTGTIVFTSLADSDEDQKTTEYLCGLVEPLLPPDVTARYVSLDKLSIDDDFLYDETGRPVDVLFRLYPIEWFADDWDDENNVSLGKMLFSLVERRKIALLNPPSAFLLQNKAVQAVIWGLYETGEFWNEAEHFSIARQFLPTYLDPVFGDDKHVVKPVLGREGDTVRIVDPAWHTVDHTNTDTYALQPVVYQQYIHMGCEMVEAAEGRHSMHILTSCFLVNGRASAIGIRGSGGPITDAHCRWIPLAVSPA